MISGIAGESEQSITLTYKWYLAREVYDHSSTCCSSVQVVHRTMLFCATPELYLIHNYITHGTVYHLN